MTKRLARGTTAANVGWAALSLTVFGCGDPASPPPSTPLEERCPDGQAPLRNGPGAARPFDCVAVGASTEAASAEWPAVDGLPQPRIFVSARAAAGGDGSLARPFAALSAGAAGLAATGGALVLARGAYALDATLTLPSNSLVVGAGAAATILNASRGRAAVVFAAGRGELRGITVCFPEDISAVTDDDLGVVARNGATLTLDDVRVEYARSGFAADGATLIASRVTALRSVFAGFDLRRGSRGVFSRLWAHHGGGLPRLGYGVYCDASVLHLSDSMITCNGVTGIWVRHAPPAMTGAASCAGDLTAPTGDTMCWSRVSLDENHAQGVEVSACRPASCDACHADPGRVNVEARLLSVRRTLQDGTRGGDGVSVGPYTRVRFDPEVTGASARGLATLIASNARAGVLVEGPGAVLSLQGATIADNTGPGVYLQAAARAEALHDSVVMNNVGLGVGVTPSSTLVEARGNRFLRTRMGPLSSGSTAMFGDGLALSQPTGLTLTNNELSDNQRFAAFMVRVESATVTANTGSGNLYGLTAYDSLVDVRAGNAVLAREAAPTVAPAAPADGMMAP